MKIQRYHKDLRFADLRPYERLVIQRRRLGLTQGEMVKRLQDRSITYLDPSGSQREMNLNAYRRMELGLRSVPIADDVVSPRASVKEHEFYFLLRRRMGMTISDLAKMMGCSEWWVIQMEAGRAARARVAAFWEKQAAEGDA